MKFFPCSFSRRTWWRALAVATVFLVSTTACSDADGEEPGITAIEVITSQNNNGAGYAESLLYSIECVGVNDEPFDNQNPADDVRVEGPFAKAGNEAYSGADVWRTLAVLPPGPCTIRVQALGANNQAICVMYESFSVSPDATTEIRLVLVCSGGIQVAECMFSQNECNTRTIEMCAVQSDCVVVHGRPLERGCLDATIGFAPVGCTAGCDVDGGFEVIMDPDGLPWLVPLGVLPQGWTSPAEPFNLAVCDDEGSR